MTTIGMAGSQRPDVAHRLEPVHAGHENVEEQQVELARLEQSERLVAVAGHCDVMTGPLQKQPDRELYGRIVIHDQDVGQIPNPPGRMRGQIGGDQVKAPNVKLLRGFCSACKHFAAGQPRQPGSLLRCTRTYARLCA